VLPLFNTVDPSVQASYWKNLPPSFKHLLGTNALGQDTFWYESGGAKLVHGSGGIVLLRAV